MSLRLQELQQLVNKIFVKLGKPNAIVGLHPTDTPIARASGLNLEPLGLPIISGTIYVHQNSLSKYTTSEITFILGHESAHILKNHIVSTALWTALELLAKGPNQKNKTLVEMTKAALAIISPDRLSPNARDLRDNEYEADRIAVRMTGDIQSAISCLIKLSGGNLNNPSHTWELFDNMVPAMTLRQRLAALRISANYL